MFGRMGFLKNLLLCILVGQVTAEKITKTEAIFFEMTNGKYSNSAQISGQNFGGDLLQLLGCPVRVRAISSKPLLYFLEAVNGTIIRARLRSIEERKPGTITMETYNITKPKFYEGPPQVFNRTEIENLKSDEIEHLVGCKAELKYNINNFTGGWEDCRDTVNGKHTYYGLNLFCGKTTVLIPVVAPEKTSLVPYELVSSNEKCPLIDAPDNYTSFCGKQNAEINK